MSSYDGPPGQFPQPGPQQPQGAFQPPAAPQAAPSGKGKKLALVGGLGAGAVVLGGGAIAATMFFSQGDQPAEVLPASTIAYASVDLDPSGGQKIEILKTLRKFPAFTEATDVDENADIMEAIFDEAVSNGQCEGLDYAKDVKPWLGQRAALAAVKGDGDEPDAVFVVQITDAGKAEEGIKDLISTCGGDTSEFGSTVSGDWAVFGESQQVVDDVVEAAAKEPLAADADYQRWTDEAGGEAIVSAYVSRHLADYADQILDATASASPLGVDEGLSGAEGLGTSSDDAAKEQLKKSLEDFQGAAMALRFDDGGLELEAAGGIPKEQVEELADGSDLVESLPEDAVAALGFGYKEGWLDSIDERLAASGTDTTLESVLGEVGLTREDVENGIGDAMALAIGSGVDVDAISNGGPEDVPAGLKVRADADDVNGLLAKVDDAYVDQTGGTSLFDEAPWLKAEGEDGESVISPNDDFRAALLDPKGSLGSTSEYKSVVDGDAQGVLFVNFNADDDWLVRAAADAGQEVTDNLEPLSALGLSWWGDGDVAHFKLRLTTD